jgi:hypothetical protein
MNFKTTYILFGLLVVLLGTLAIVLYTGPTEKPGGDRLFPSMHAKDDPLKSRDVTKVVIQRKKPADGDLVFERVDDTTWKITAPRALAADSSRVNNLIDSLMELRHSDQEGVPSSLKKVGLDAPARIVKIHGQDKEWTLNIGETTVGDDALAYVTSSDRKSKPVAIKKRDIDSALEGLSYFRQKELLGSDHTDIRQIKITEGKKTSIELKKENDRWRMVQPPYGAIDATEFVSKLTDLKVDHKNDKETDFVKDGVSNLAEYHLDPARADVLRIAVTRGEGKKASTVTAVVGISKEVKGQKKYYAAVEEGKTRDIVQVPVDSVKPFADLINDPSKLRNKNLLALEGFKQPDAIDVTNSWGLLEFRRPDSTKPWDLYRGTISTKVDDAEVRKLIDELNKKDAGTSFADPSRKKELGLEKPEIVVKVWADSLDKPDEKKPGKPTFKKGARPAAELRFGILHQGMVAVERVWEGDTAIVMVPPTLLDQMRKGPLAYMDKSLPRFNPGLRSDQDVNKIEIVRGSETIEISRATEKDPWKFTKPANLQGRQASSAVLNNILDDLNTLRAEEIVREKADQKDLALFELAKPPVRVTVTITKDKKSTTHTFDLGKEVAGKGVYLKRGDKEMVYLVTPTVLQAIKKELRDTSIFNFDPNKVTTLTIKGWANVVGAPFTLALEQKDGQWTAKMPAGYNLDTTRVADLVRDLSHLMADKFVPSGKGLKSAEGALEIQIGLPDKKSVTLTIGEAEGGTFFATSDQLKGDVFTIPRGSFDEMKKAPVYFQKK